jgi:hypothetical protein
MEKRCQNDLLRESCTLGQLRTLHHVLQLRYGLSNVIGISVPVVQTENLSDPRLYASFFWMLCGSAAFHCISFLNVSGS